jgi:hypothetical protein
MNTILISYDLMSPGKDYSALHKHIESYGNWAKPLESFWFIRTNNSAEIVRNLAMKYIDVNDKLFVVEITGMASAWQNLSNEVVNWIGSKL